MTKVWLLYECYELVEPTMVSIHASEEGASLEGDRLKLEFSWLNYVVEENEVKP